MPPLLSRLRGRLQCAARIVIVLAALALAGSFGALLYATFDESPSAINAAGVGTAQAPYSDALGPWLDSSMSYYVRGVPLPYLYRPTVGLFYSTIISATSSVAAVPIAWIFLLFAAGSAIFVLADWPHRLALVGAIGTFVLFFDQLVSPLDPASLMVNFWPMAMSLVGIWLIALGEESTPSDLAASLAGFFLLGIAGCVRGPQLASGAALLALLTLGRLRRREGLALVLMAISFAAPLAIDSIIRKRNGIAGDALVTLYGFYADPHHVWSNASDLRYLQEQPKSAEVYSHYLQFLFSGPGMRIFWANCRLVIGQAVDLATQDTFLQTLPVLAIAGWLAGRSQEPSSASSAGSKWTKGVILAVLAILAIGTIYLDTDSRAWVFVALVTSLALYAIVTGRRLTAMLTVAFCAALAFHAALGLVAGPRVTPGYEILILAALVAAVAERSRLAALRPRLLRGVTGAVFVLVFVGYTGNFWLRTGFKAGLRGALAAPQTAMKVSNSLPLNRSLYAMGDGGVFYTSYDPLPFGTVRHFRRLETPEGIGDVTFLHPCVVEWDRNTAAP
jgi:hypothetical protein